MMCDPPAQVPVVVLSLVPPLLLLLTNSWPSSSAVNCIHAAFAGNNDNDRADDNAPDRRLWQHQLEPPRRPISEAAKLYCDQCWAQCDAGNNNRQATKGRRQLQMSSGDQANDDKSRVSTGDNNNFDWTQVTAKEDGPNELGRGPDWSAQAECKCRAVFEPFRAEPRRLRCIGVSVAWAAGGDRRSSRTHKSHPLETISRPGGRRGGEEEQEGGPGKATDKSQIGNNEHGERYDRDEIVRAIARSNAQATAENGAEGHGRGGSNNGPRSEWTREHRRKRPHRCSHRDRVGAGLRLGGRSRGKGQHSARRQDTRSKGLK